MIGWCPSFRVGVAVRPTTYLAFTCLITCSNVKADMWWHSSTITWPYSATKSFTSSFRVQALNDGDVHAPGPVRFPTTDMPDRFGRHIQEHPKALLPLIEQLLSVNDDQSV